MLAALLILAVILMVVFIILYVKLKAKTPAPNPDTSALRPDAQACYCNNQEVRYTHLQVSHSQ